MDPAHAFASELSKLSVCFFTRFIICNLLGMLLFDKAWLLFCVAMLDYVLHNYS